MSGTIILLGRECVILGHGGGVEDRVFGTKPGSECRFCGECDIFERILVDCALEIPMMTVSMGNSSHEVEHIILCSDCFPTPSAGIETSG